LVCFILLNYFCPMYWRRKNKIQIVSGWYRQNFVRSCGGVCCHWLCCYKL